MKDPDRIYRRYQDLQSYLAWTDEDARRVRRLTPLLEPHLPALFSRIPAPELKPFAVESCVREALEDSVVPGRVESVVDFPADLPPALADPSQLRIVQDNLIRNAVDAMPSGVCLTLTGRRGEDGLEVAVADSGVGIAPADLGRVMEPLFSTKARGTSLGLALSRMIINRNHGGLSVVSELGKGSTFTVRLSVATSERETPR